jgi:hypothetical protein
MKFMIYEIPTVIVLSRAIFWDVNPCSLLYDVTLQEITMCIRFNRIVCWCMETIA